MTKLSSPLVSILIANYNNKKFLKKCITSCLNQNYKNIEIIIFDDCSTDGSQNFLSKFRKKKILKYFITKKKN
jgi:glycosyltransferase involved in cell wall biosynthesis